MSNLNSSSQQPLLNRTKTRPYNYNPLRALIPSNATSLISIGSPNKKLERALKKKAGRTVSEEKSTTQKRLGSPTPWKNPSQVLEYNPPAHSKIHIPADHPQLNELASRGKSPMIDLKYSKFHCQSIFQTMYDAY